MFVYIGIIFIIGAIGFLGWASYPWSLHESRYRSEISYIETNEMQEIQELPSVIKILTFNIGFLYGKGSEGPGYEYRDREYYKNSIDKISTSLKEWGADIVFFQEIDFASSRSNFINQAEEIAKKAGYPYLAEAKSWSSHYIPFPYWPVANHFGQMSSGGAILSKYPLRNHEITLLEKPKSSPWWYNLFYLHRYFQKVMVEIGDKKFNLINLHLEAFDKEDRKLQILKLKELLIKEKIDFVAGDFNMLPDVATKRSKFFNDDNYENDSSYRVMKESPLLEVVPDDIYLKEENAYFTFPAWAPDRRLDYIWYKKELKMMRAEVLPSALSDHLPLKASFQIDGPRFNPYSQ